MDTKALAELARSLSKSEFVARHPSWFLVIAQVPEPLAMGFETKLMPRHVLHTPAARDGVHYEVLEIKKAPGNPYPERISVGRARNCDVVLRYPLVSKLHAHFLVLPGRAIELVDHRSKNGTRVNGQALAGDQPTRVAAGDTLEFASVTAKLLDAAGVHHLFR
jgi:hypothetical protein